MKLLSIIDRPLGLVNPYAPQKKEVVPWATLASVGLSTISSLFGGGAAANAMEEYKKMLRVHKASENAGFTRQKYESVLDKAYGQNLVRRAKQGYDRSIKRAEGAKAVAGGTDASVQMAKDSANQAMGDTIANIAAMDSTRQDRIDSEKRASDRAYTQQMAGLEAQRAQNITNAAQQASNALMSVGSAVDQMNAAKVDVKGSANNSTDFKGTDVTPASLHMRDANNNLYTSKATGITGTIDEFDKLIRG